jgi:hypothetical protein
MKKCLESGKYDDRIAGDMAIAQQIGFRGNTELFRQYGEFRWSIQLQGYDASAVEEASEEITSRFGTYRYSSYSTKNRSR